MNTMKFDLCSRCGRVYIIDESVKSKMCLDCRNVGVEDYLGDIPSDEFEIDPVDEADRRARLECAGMQYWTIHRHIKMRPVGVNPDRHDYKLKQLVEDDV